MKFPTLLGLMVSLLLIASFVLPGNPMSPAPVEAGICKWDYMVTPIVPGRNDIVRCSELHEMVVGNDDKTVIITANRNTTTRLYYSSNSGRSFSGSRWTALSGNPQ